MEKQVKRVAWLISLVAVGMGVAFVPLGTLVAGLPFGDSINVRHRAPGAPNVPEGLLPTITLALAVGVRQLARRGALVKRISAVETLGSTTVICTDKTGTLTLNQMRVTHAWTTLGTVDPPGADLTTLSTQPVDIDAPLGRLAQSVVACNNARLGPHDETSRTASETRPSSRCSTWPGGWG